MDQKGKERLQTLEAGESKEAPQKSEIGGTKEIQKEAASVVETAGVEAVQGKEAGVELSEGKVGEQVSELKKKGPAGAWPATKTADEIETIRARLLQNLPSHEIMMHQIKQTLRRQEKDLQKQYKKVRRMGDKAAYKLNIVVAQLRKIREFLSVLANATFEMIKNLWLKIVHGV